MQYAMRAPLPPHEPPGRPQAPAGPAGVPGAPGAPVQGGAHPPVPAAPAAPPVPPAPGHRPYPGPGPAPMPAAGPAPAPQGPPAAPHPPAPPVPPAPSAAPAPAVAPGAWAASGQATGHLTLPPPATGGTGTGTATIAVLLIGPAGAGKTTVARHWATRRRVPTAHISLDDVREWVCSGFADPQSGWNEHSEAQYRLARRTCGFAARNFLANGISCILDDAVFPDWPVVGLGGWKRHVGPGLLPVVLLPGLDVVLERNAERSGNRRLSDEEVAAIHGRMAGWYGSGLPIIDNSTYDVETTARVLDDVLARAISGQHPTA
ncbi:AAA family ATPase [Streptomyces sp. NPDC048718]|uniref:AAA family ATPase n=1 Tax=Streptomyces sp. NPDC048718 TaxID=3365587 RepID=UPI0037158090